MPSRGSAGASIYPEMAFDSHFEILMLKIRMAKMRTRHRDGPFFLRLRHWLASTACREIPAPLLVQSRGSRHASRNGRSWPHPQRSRLFSVGCPSVAVGEILIEPAVEYGQNSSCVGGMKQPHFVDICVELT